MRLFAVAVLGALLWIAGCGSSSTGTVTSSPSPLLLGTVTVTMSTCSFSGKASITSGLVSMKLVNQTGVAAGFDVWPIPKDRTYADAAAFVAEEHALAEAGKPFRNPYTFFTDGGPSLRMALTKDATEDVSTTLGPGMLVIVCLRFHPSLNEDRPSGVAGPITVV
jgi:hypothetical protein